jgi:hypothetical protein
MKQNYFWRKRFIQPWRNLLGGRLAPICRITPLLLLAACSSNWTAALELKLAPGAVRQPLSVTLHSTLGGEFSGVLAGDCLEVRIRQSPKLKNQISIHILDAQGRVLGTASTNDLANRDIEIALAEQGVVTVRPGIRCR